MNNQKWNVKLGMATMGVVALLTAGSVYAEPSQQAEQSVKTLFENYEKMHGIPVPKTDTGGDIQVFCTTLVFKQWSDVYMQVLDHSDVPIERLEASLNHFGRDYFGIEPATKIIEYFRPGITEQVQKVLENRRIGASIAPFSASAITLAEIQDRQYLAMLKQCISKKFVNEILPLVGTVDATKVIPGELLAAGRGTVHWENSGHGGIRAIFSPETSERNLKGTTYQDYLDSFNFGGE